MDSMILKKIWHTGEFSKCHLNAKKLISMSPVLGSFEKHEPRYINWTVFFQWDITNIDDAIRIICVKIAVIQDHRLGFGFVDLKTKISEYLV